MKRTYTPRQLVINRQPATDRIPAVGRKLITPPSNGKLNVILDTNILYSRLLAEARSHTDSACYKIIEELRNDAFNLIQPLHLFEEYKYELYRLCQLYRLIPNKRILKYQIDLLLDLTQKKSHYGRTYVLPNIMPSDPDDAQIFNTTFIGSVNFIVTKDARDLIKKKVPNIPTTLEIIGPNAFLRKLYRYRNTES
ncbi:MAG TPA: PIN domain-containing protein [Patescibacteria group bacterium]|nr:PIN domain-containing protein [Patescibacteria group bacterium]